LEGGDAVREGEEEEQGEEGAEEEEDGWVGMWGGDQIGQSIQWRK
jgi:hypothetical protein